MAHARAASTSPPWRVSWRRLLTLGVLGAVLYVLIPRFSEFENSLTVLKTARVDLLIPAALGVVLTFLVAAFLYCVLAFHKLSYKRTAVVQGATGFANRLLPAGLGGLGLNAAFLHRSRHTLAEASSVVVVNNVLGFVGHMLLLAVLVASGVVQRWPVWQVHVLRSIEFAVGIVIVLAGVLLIVRHNTLLRRIHEFVQPFTQFGTHRLGALGAGLCCAMGITALNVAIFYLALTAVGTQVQVGAAFVAFTVGVAAATVTPTPGGLGGAEAGLTAGLAGYGVAVDQALAAALLFRLLTYWLPIVPGAVFFATVLHRKYV